MSSTIPAPQDYISTDYAAARADAPGRHFPDSHEVARRLAAGRTRAECVHRRDGLAGLVGTRTMEADRAEIAAHKDPTPENRAAWAKTRAQVSAVTVEHEAWCLAVLFAS